MLTLEARACYRSTSLDGLPHKLGYRDASHVFAGTDGNGKNCDRACMQTSCRFSPEKHAAPGLDAYVVHTLYSYRVFPEPSALVQRRYVSKFSDTSQGPAGSGWGEIED